MHNYLIKAYITKVSLCNLKSYKFGHSLFIIREFTTNALLIYTRSSVAAVDYTIIKLKYFTQICISSQILFVEITIFKIIKILKYCPFYKHILMTREIVTPK